MHPVLPSWGTTLMQVTHHSASLKRGELSFGLQSVEHCGVKATYDIPQPARH